MLSPCSPLNSLEHLESEYCLDAFSIATSDSDASHRSIADTGATSPAASCSTHQQTATEEEPRSFTCSNDKDTRTGSSSCLTAHGKFQKALLELMSDTGMSLVEGPGGVGARSSRGPCRTTSKCRGVTKHRRTEKWEAHFWHHGKQLYLGGFQSESCAAKAHDIIALKCRGRTAETNYLLESYKSIIDLLPHITKDELIRLVRRQSCSSAAATAKGRPATKKVTIMKKVEPSTGSPSPQIPSRRSSRIQVRCSAAGVDIPNVKQLLSDMADSARSDLSRHLGAVSPEPNVASQRAEAVPTAWGYTKVVPARQRSLNVVLPPATQADGGASEAAAGLVSGATSSPYLSSLSPSHRQTPPTTPRLPPSPHDAMRHPRKPNLPPLHLSLPQQQTYSPSPYSSLSCNTSALLSQSPVASTSTHMVWPSPRTQQGSGISNPTNLANNILSSQINLTQQISLCRQNITSPGHDDMCSPYSTTLPTLPYSSMYDMYNAANAGHGVPISGMQAPASSFAAQQALMQPTREAIPGLMALQQQQSLMLANLQQQHHQQLSKQLQQQDQQQQHHHHHLLSQQFQQHEQQQQQANLVQSMSTANGLLGMDDSFLLDSVLQEHFNLPAVGTLVAGGTGTMSSAPRANTMGSSWGQHRTLDNNMGDVDVASLMGVGSLTAGGERLGAIQSGSGVPDVQMRLKTEEPNAAMAAVKQEEQQDVFGALDCPASPLLVYTELQDSLNW